MKNATVIFHWTLLNEGAYESLNQSFESLNEAAFFIYCYYNIFVLIFFSVVSQEIIVFWDGLQEM